MVFVKCNRRRRDGIPGDIGIDEYLLGRLADVAVVEEDIGAGRRRLDSDAPGAPSEVRQFLGLFPVEELQFWEEVLRPSKFEGHCPMIRHGCRMALMVALNWSVECVKEES
ncbi:MAG: hypothetical protein BECKG1743D_GA0114223_110091 [Candidatus Kentron sp. G]